MTVKELIEKLKNYPEDMDCYTTGLQVGGNIFDCEASQISFYIAYVKDEGFIKYIAHRPCKETAGAKKCLIL